MVVSTFNEYFRLRFLKRFLGASLRRQVKN